MSFFFKEVILILDTKLFYTFQYEKHLLLKFELGTLWLATVLGLRGSVQKGKGKSIRVFSVRRRLINFKGVSNTDINF